MVKNLIPPICIALLILFLSSCRKDKNESPLSTTGDFSWADILVHTGNDDPDITYPYTGVEINDMDFVSENRVVAVGARLDSYSRGSRCFVSEDRGKSWNLGGYGGGEGQFNHCTFVDENIGYAVNQSSMSPYLYKTTNGGYNWSPLGPDLMGGYHIGGGLHFITDQIGFLSRFKTIDGGLSWTETASLESIYDYSFLNETTGFGASNNGKIYKTIDAGESWTELESPASEERLSKCLFINDDLGFGISALGLHRTEDGGQNWTTVSDMEILDIYFKNTQIGFLTAGGNTIYKTDDGGLTWVQNVSSEFYKILALAGSENIVLAGGRNNGTSTVKPQDYEWFRDFILRTETLGE